ncbi:MAG: carboxypeptidase-like regulatory domain-containing protein [Flavobacteriales bacterium]
MNKLLLCLFLGLVGISSFSLGQDQAVISIEGIIKNSDTEKPLPYCNIINYRTYRGTISNESGYFKLYNCLLGDTIEISFIGYSKKLVVLNERPTFLSVSLKEESNQLADAIVTPKSKEYLYELVSECRKIKITPGRDSKAYYELKSHINEEQVELVETFYNARQQRLNLLNLGIKAGRLALKKFDNRLFASIENSKAIVMHSTLDENKYFPPSPIELSKRKCKKRFSLRLDKKYVNDQNDSVYVISYTPISEVLDGFSGKLWINKTQQKFLRVELECENCRTHPFLPLFPLDSISDVNLRIYKTFISDAESTKIDFIDFTTDYVYNSRKDSEAHKEYNITSEAVLYLYDYDKAFKIPELDLPKIGITDYARINAMPYNEFFWKNNNEYKLNDERGENEAFFSSDSTLTNKTLFRKKAINKKSNLFEYPFVHWTGDRFLLREMSNNVEETQTPVRAFHKDYYNLEVEVFLDINTYNDSTHALTSTLVNPYRTFYYLPVDEYAQCAINIFFDLVEIENRAFNESIKENASETEILNQYEKLKLRISNLKKTYFSQVVRGTNRPMLEKWNAIVNEKLEIDNISLFGIYQDIEPD